MKFNDLQFEPHSIGGGIQALVFFENGYGASIVQFEHSYGGLEGLYELAVLEGNKNEWNICYSTRITDDVLGYMAEADVINILNEIVSLKPGD